MGPLWRVEEALWEARGAVEGGGRLAVDLFNLQLKGEMLFDRAFEAAADWPALCLGVRMAEEIAWINGTAPEVAGCERKGRLWAFERGSHGENEDNCSVAQR